MQLALVIDLGKCVGCKGCQVSCKAWNTSGLSGPLPDFEPYGADPNGLWFKRVHTIEVGHYPETTVLHMPKACMHCYEPPCVPVCPTGASFKRSEDGIVIVDAEKCVGCQLCTWSCPYGVREFDEHQGVVKKCNLCVDRIYNEELPEKERIPSCVLACPTRAHYFGDIEDPESEVSKLIAENSGFTLLPEQGTRPSVHYLPLHAQPPIDYDEEEEGVTVR